MSYSNFGFKSNVKTIKSNSNSTIKNSEGNIIEIRVTNSIITSSDSDKFKLPIGTIIGTSTDSNNIGKIYTANPLNPNITNIPLSGELVDLFKSTSPNSNGVQWLYGQPKGVYGTTSVNNNGVESKLSPNKTTPKSNIQNYQAASLGIPLTQPSQHNTQPAQSIENSKISSLEPNPGDIIYEGRYGQSLRLGNNEGNPIVILRNGQDPNIQVEPGKMVKENIQDDMSSLYLTSNQKIDFTLSAPLLSNGIKSPKEYVGPQSILNSDRVIINSKKDSVLISGKQNVGVFAQSGVTIGSPSTIIQSSRIMLGDENATESGIKGDSLYGKLNIITTSLINLITVLEVQQVWAGGVSSPDGGENLVAAVTKKQLTDVKNSLKDILSTIVKIA